MSDRQSGFLEDLAGMIEQSGHFNIVARRRLESQAPGQFDPKDLPIVRVIADKNDNELCMVQGASLDVNERALNLESFYQMLQTQLELYPNYTLMVSEYFQIDDEHIGRIDVPLASFEVDEKQKSIRLLF